MRFSRGPRFRRDVQLIAEALGENPTALAARILDVLARFADLAGHDVGEAGWTRLLDALILVVLHPEPASAH